MSSACVPQLLTYNPAQGFFYYYWILAFARMTTRQSIKKPPTKHLRRHAGALENYSCVSSISARPGGHHPYPVDH